MLGNIGFVLMPESESPGPDLHLMDNFEPPAVSLRSPVSILLHEGSV